ncbi:hypothetical protein [Roseateles sp. PN1]|uniref:hypothetical protein n=1 Tax=Roseateles sp. PN1 TaxID=3137372 RepID=UPI003139304D
MKNETDFIVNFYLPILASVIIFFVTLLAPKFLAGIKQPTIETEIRLGIVGFKIPLSLWVKNIALTKAFCYVLSIALLIYAFSIDFSRYFPALLKMDVYYDVNGIERTLGRLDSQDRAQLDIDKNWHSGVEEYDRDVVVNIQSLWTKQGLPNYWPENVPPRPYFSGSGQATFVVERTAFLTYKIVESIGKLTYSTTSPRNEVKTFSGASKLKPTAASYIRPTIGQLLAKQSVLIMPEFMQIFGAGSVHDGMANGEYDHALIAATKISLLPMPSVGDTVFLWRSKTGKWVPIAYAIYR